MIGVQLLDRSAGRVLGRRKTGSARRAAQRDAQPPACHGAWTSAHLTSRRLSISVCSRGACSSSACASSAAAADDSRTHPPHRGRRADGRRAPTESESALSGDSSYFPPRRAARTCASFRSREERFAAKLAPASSSCRSSQSSIGSIPQGARRRQNAHVVGGRRHSTSPTARARKRACPTSPSPRDAAASSASNDPSRVRARPQSPRSGGAPLGSARARDQNLVIHHRRIRPSSRFPDATAVYDLRLDGILKTGFRLEPRTRPGRQAARRADQLRLRHRRRSRRLITIEKCGASSSKLRPVRARPDPASLRPRSSSIASFATPLLSAYRCSSAFFAGELSQREFCTTRCRGSSARGDSRADAPAGAGKSARQEGVNIAREMLEGVRGRVAGAYIIRAGTIRASPRGHRRFVEK